jgi:hypothetical protein
MALTLEVGMLSEPLGGLLIERTRILAKKLGGSRQRLCDPRPEFFFQHRQNLLADSNPGETLVGVVGVLPPFQTRVDEGLAKSCSLDS